PTIPRTARLSWLRSAPTEAKHIMQGQALEYPAPQCPLHELAEAQRETVGLFDGQGCEAGYSGYPGPRVQAQSRPACSIQNRAISVLRRLTGLPWLWRGLRPSWATSASKHPPFSGLFVGVAHEARRRVLAFPPPGRHFLPRAHLPGRGDFPPG